MKFAHTKQAITLDGLENINVDHLKKLEKQFIDKTENSFEIKLPKKFFLPLAAKTLNRTFNLQEENPNKRRIIESKLQDFTFEIDEYSDKYIRTEQMGETAYAFYNVITDYASNSNKLQASAINGLQAKCGMWINEIGELITKPNFKWEDEIKDFTYLMQEN